MNHAVWSSPKYFTECRRGLDDQRGRRYPMCEMLRHERPWRGEFFLPAIRRAVARVGDALAASFAWSCTVFWMWDPAALTIPASGRLSRQSRGLR